MKFLKGTIRESLCSRKLMLALGKHESLSPRKFVLAKVYTNKGARTDKVDILHFYEIGKAYSCARRLRQYIICTSRRFQKPSGDESQYFYHHMIPQANVHVYLINFKNETCLF